MTGILLTPYHQTVRDLSERLVQAQPPIRVLDAIKWDASIHDAFFEAKCKELPKVDQSYYQRNVLPFDLTEKKEELYTLERDVRKQLGQFSAVGGILQRM